MSIRRYDLPGTPLSVVFLNGVNRGRVEIRNGANGTAVDMSEDAWAELVGRAHYARALAQPVESAAWSGQTGIYTLHTYTATHRAIDCERCHVKVANLRPTTSSAVIIDRLQVHEREKHPQ